MHVHTTRETMINASFTKTIREAMDNFFNELKNRLVSSDSQIDEIKKMMDVMYEKFSKEHGLRKSEPPAFQHCVIRKSWRSWSVLIKSNSTQLSI